MLKPAIIQLLGISPPVQSKAKKVKKCFKILRME